jgi:hypothetical protein
MANAPLVGWDAQGSRSDLGGVKTEIFLQRGLDTAVDKPPDGQITTRRREQFPLVSRTRCSTLHAAPQSQDPFRRQARWTPDQQRTTPQSAAQHPGNGGVLSTVPRVPDAVQRPSRCSAEPGPIAEPAARRAQTRWWRVATSGERSARALCINAIDGCRGVYLSRAPSCDAVAGPARGLPNFALKSANADPGDSILLSKAYFRSDRCVSR